MAKYKLILSLDDEIIGENIPVSNLSTAIKIARRYTEDCNTCKVLDRNNKIVALYRRKLANLATSSSAGWYRETNYNINNHIM